MNDELVDGKYAYYGLERIMHEKARLSIMTSLFTNKNGYTFNELKKLCDLTDGNLSRHLNILKENKYINIDKYFDGNKPTTKCKITDTGIEKFKMYMNELEKVIKDVVGNDKLINSDLIFKLNLS